MTMLVEYLDSFDYPAAAGAATVAALRARGWDVVLTATLQLSGASPITGTGTLRRSLGNTFYAARYLSGAYPSLSIRCRYSHTRSTANGDAFLSVWDETAVQLNVYTPNTNGDLRVSCAGVDIITAVGAIGDDSDHEIELVFKIAASGGFAELWVDGASVGSFSGDTQNTANAYVTRVIIGHVGDISYTCAWDDLRIYRPDTGDAVAMGPSRVYVKRPTGDTAEAAFVPNVGSDSYAVVDEVIDNGDTDYLESGTDGDRTRLTGPAVLGTLGDVLGAQVLVIARKTDHADRSLVFGVAEGDDDEASAHALTSKYAPYLHPFINAPGGSGLVASDLTDAHFLLEASQ